jgi:hypothetical protein
MIIDGWLRGYKQYRSICHAYRMLDRHVKTDQEIDQRVIVTYLVLKRLSARAIHEDLITTIGFDAMAYSTVVHDLHDVHCSPSSLGTSSIEVWRGFNDSDQTILAVREENFFASVRQLSCLTHIPSTTVYRHLTESFWFTMRHL